MSSFDEGVCKDWLTGFCYVCALKDVLVAERAAHAETKAALELLRAEIANKELDRYARRDDRG